VPAPKSAALAVVSPLREALVTDVATLLTRIIDQLSEVSLRVAELEADLTVERERRMRAERALQAQIEDEGLEKYNHHLSNSASIDVLQRRVGDVESALAHGALNAGAVILVPLETGP
jgi:hypothetical protein